MEQARGSSSWGRTPRTNPAQGNTDLGGVSSAATGAGRIITDKYIKIKLTENGHKGTEYSRIEKNNYNLHTISLRFPYDFCSSTEFEFVKLAPAYLATGSRKIKSRNGPARSAESEFAKLVPARRTNIKCGTCLLNL